MPRFRGSRYVMMPGYRPAPEAAALFARMTAPPDAACKAVIDRFIGRLKASSIWDRLDVLGVFAAHDGQASLLNWRQAAYDFAITGSPVFAANQGYTGHPASSAALVATGYNPATISNPRLTLNDAHCGIYTRTAATYDAANSRIDLFMGTARLQRRATTNDTHYTFRINDGTSNNAAISGQTGHMVAQRTAAGARANYRDGTQQNTDATASTSVASSLSVFGTTSNFSDAQISVVHAGASLSAGQLTEFTAALAEYLTAVGAI